MKSLASFTGNFIGSFAAAFLMAAVITFIMKKILVYFAKGDRKITLENEFPVIKVSLIYAVIAALLSFFGLNGGYYLIPLAIVGNFIYANSK